jgi:inosose dehydratase
VNRLHGGRSKSGGRVAMIEVGNGPDSWGVWFADAPGQISWPDYLTEVRAAGYELTELGPYGYAPTRPAHVAEDLRRAGLRALAAFVEADLSVPAAAEMVTDAVDRMATIVAGVEGRFVNVIDAAYRDLETGKELGPSELDEGGWHQLTTMADRLGAMVRDRHGLTLTFHPHVDTHVERGEQIERFLGETDPAAVSLVFDTGHHAYRGGDPVDFFRRHYDRIAYLHLKSVDPDVRAVVDAEDLPLVEAVKRGVFCEPAAGAVDFVALGDAIRAVGFTGPACVEQDMHRPAAGRALDIATRTRDYLRRIGIG